MNDIYIFIQQLGQTYEHNCNTIATTKNFPISQSVVVEEKAFSGISTYIFFTRTLRLQGLNLIYYQYVYMNICLTEHLMMSGHEDMDAISNYNLAFL